MEPGKEETILSPIARSWVLPRIFYLQKVCSLSILIALKYSNAEGIVWYTTIYNGRNDSRLGLFSLHAEVKLLLFITRICRRLCRAIYGKLSEQMLSSMANDISIFDICAKYGLNSDLLLLHTRQKLSDDYPIRNAIARGHDLLDMAKKYHSADPGKKYNHALMYSLQIPQRHVQPGLY